MKSYEIFKIYRKHLDIIIKSGIIVLPPSSFGSLNSFWKIIQGKKFILLKLKPRTYKL